MLTHHRGPRLATKHANARWLMEMNFGSPVLPDVVMRYAVGPDSRVMAEGDRATSGNKVQNGQTQAHAHTKVRRNNDGNCKDAKTQQSRMPYCEDAH